MEKTQAYIKRLKQLTNKDVVLVEAEDNKDKEQKVDLSKLQNQFMSMAQLNDRFKAKDFVPGKEIFHISVYKYEFKRIKPESLDSIKLLQTERTKMEVIYVCKKEKSIITFFYTTGDGLLQPSKAILEK